MSHHYLASVSHISVLGPMKKRVTKKGRMASTSTMFIPSLRKAHLSGAPARRMKYSRVNQAMHTVSIIARVGLSIVFPDASCQHNYNIYLQTASSKKIDLVLKNLEGADGHPDYWHSHKDCRQNGDDLIRGKLSNVMVINDCYQETDLRSSAGIGFLD